MTIQKAVPVSTKETEARGPISVFVPPGKNSLRSAAYNHDLKRIKQFDDFTCSHRMI